MDQQDEGVRVQKYQHRKSSSLTASLHQCHILSVLWSIFHQFTSHCFVISRSETLCPATHVGMESSGDEDFVNPVSVSSSSWADYPVQRDSSAEIPLSQFWPTSTSHDDSPQDSRPGISLPQFRPRSTPRHDDGGSTRLKPKLPPLSQQDRQQLCDVIVNASCQGCVKVLEKIKERGLIRRMTSERFDFCDSSKVYVCADYSSVPPTSMSISHC